MDVDVAGPVETPAGDLLPKDEIPAAVSVTTLLRQSFKRTLELFFGNVGTEAPKTPDAVEQRKKRLRLKIQDEFSTVAEEAAAGTIILAVGDPSFIFLSGPTAAGAPQPKLAGPSTALQLVPPPTGAQLSKVPIGPSVAGASEFALARPPVPGASSNVLQHLTFRRTPKIPKAVEHPKWELMRVISGHQGWVRTLCVDPTNEWFVSGGNDRLIKIWDLATGTLKLSLTGHINTIRALQVSHRHPYLFSCGEDQMVKCWDLEYNKVIRHYHGHLSGVYSMTLHPTLDILATGGRDAVVRVWDMRTKHAIHVLAGHTGTVMSLTSQRFEPQIISGSLDKMVRCWDLAAGKTAVVLTHHKKAVRGLALHPREYTFCSAGADHLKVWKCPKGNFERNLENVGTIINSIAIRDEPESAVVIGGSDQGHLHFWDWASGQKFQTIEAIPQPGSLSSEKAIYSVCLDMSETRLLTGECDKTIKVWREQASS